MKHDIFTKMKMNNRKKCFELVTSRKQEFEFPFSRLRSKPSEKNPLVEAFIDSELANEVITYRLKDGTEDCLVLDQVLDYSGDPEFKHKMLLYRLTLEANEILEKSPLSRRAVIRRMKSSPTQFYRLLDTTFYGKTIDQMIRLIEALDYEVDWRVHKKAA